MKKIYFPVIVLSFFALITGLTSCKKGGFLTPTSITDLTDSTVFIDSARTNQFLTDIYTQIGFSAGASRFGNGGLDAAADESHPSGAAPTNANYWASGTINAAIVSSDVFNICYSKIRAVNQLLKNIHKTKLVLPDNRAGSRAQLVAEARFLRAWYYSLLLKHYGGVPIVGDNIYDYSEAIPVKRSTYAETVNYIVSECDEAGKVLGLIGPKQVGPFYGRASLGACLALKSRVLLYAASPLFNSDSDVPGETPMDIASAEVKPLVGYTEGSSRERWKLAKDAAYAVALTGAYKLNVENGDAARPGKGFQGLYTQRVNDEYILQWMLPATNYNTQLENFWLPPSRSGNNGGAYPYQETVEMFPMRDGKDITDNTSDFAYDPQNPFANRDPRLNYSIIHDQTVLQNRLQPGARSAVNLYYNKTANGEVAFDGDVSGTKTGYYTYKMIDTSSTGTDALNPAERCQPLIRYAEIILNYAEALNEYDPTADSVYTLLKAIRSRAGILPGTDGLYGLKPNMSQIEKRAAIQKERRIELAFEEHRFWDLRRWKLAPQALNGKLFKGIRIVKDGNVKTYTTFGLPPQHTFTTRMYLWPFPQSEVGKSPDLLQNPQY